MDVRESRERDGCGNAMPRGQMREYTSAAERVVNGDSSNGGLTACACDLIEPLEHIARCVYALNAGLLVGVDNNAAVHRCGDAGVHGKFTYWIAAKTGIEHVKAFGGAVHGRLDGLAESKRADRRIRDTDALHAGRLSFCWRRLPRPLPEI